MANLLLVLWAAGATAWLVFLKTRSRVADKATQSMCTYTGVRGSEKPRFSLLSEFSQG